MKTTITVDEYLEKVPEPARSTLIAMRERIRAAAPREATEGISYGMPAFRYKGPLVGYAAFSEHCSFFPMSGTLVDDFKEELKNFKTAKGTIQVPIGKPLSAALIKKIVKARVTQNESKSTTPRGKS